MRHWAENRLEELFKMRQSLNISKNDMYWLLTIYPDISDRLMDKLEQIYFDAVCGG